MSKRLLYVTSSFDADTQLTAQAYKEKKPYGHAQVLYHLVNLGWTIRRLSFHDTKSLTGLARFLADYQATIVFTNGSTALAPVWARKLTRKWSGPVVCGWDDFYEDMWRTAFGRLPGIFMHWFEKRIVVGSDYIITISRYNQKRAESWGKKTWYIPNGCDIPQYDASACPIRLEGAMKMVYCGDQAAYKRTEDIVRAMSHVPSDIKLYLIGTPNPALTPFASPNVIFLGRLPENDKWSVMNQADVLVCTADTDCNAKFHEYLRMKKPILGYDGIPNYLFTNRRNALLTRDYPSAIMALFQSPALRISLTDNASQDIPVYTWREIAGQYHQAFSEIAKLHAERQCHP